MSKDLKEKLQSYLDKSSTIFLGKEKVIKMATLSILSGGHLLIEDVPGVGKTTLVYLLSRLMGMDVSRIQFTNDLLPADIIGTMIYDKESHSFSFKKGPIFGNIILADELNRANPKTQSALLQVMEEKQISVEGEHFMLEDPYIVIATQNPHQYIGTFELPESQLDRFFMSLQVNYPSRNYEKEIIKTGDIRKNVSSLEPILTKDEIVKIQKDIEEIFIKDDLLEYALDIIEEGRRTATDTFSFSVRTSIDLVKGAKAHAYMEGRDFVLPDDIKEVAPYILGHRIHGNKGIKNGSIKVKDIIERIQIP